MGQGDAVHDVQAIKERLPLNIEFARPKDFVPLSPEAKAAMPSSKRSGE